MLWYAAMLGMPNVANLSKKSTLTHKKNLYLDIFQCYVDIKFIKQEGKFIEMCGVDMV